MSPFLVTQLSQFFQRHTVSQVLIAYSGGLDSHVLLHLCASLRAIQPQIVLRAIHIDHGLQAVSAQWVTHCQTVCAALNIPFICEALHLKVQTGESVEAVAREARYAVFSQYLRAGEMLLTAHHQDDQAETVLLHLLRGSGVDGLAAMPEIRPLAQGYLGRPLLRVSRAELVTYAQQNQLNYITDPSNEDNRFDRNFLRQKIIPLLQQRWVTVNKTLARAARLQGETRQLLAQTLSEKLLQLQGTTTETLSVQALLKHEPIMQKALLREWLAQHRFLRPEQKKMTYILTDILQARPDAMPFVRWEGCEIRRYRDDLYAMSPLTPHDTAQVLMWENITQPLYIESLGKTLFPEILGAWQVYLKQHTDKVSVRFRQGGESLYLPARGGHHALKHLLQEWGIPPWQRERLPLIYVGAKLVCIPPFIFIPPT